MTRNSVRVLFGLYFLTLLTAVWWPFDFARPTGPKAYMESFDPSLIRHRGKLEKDTLKVAMFIPIGILLLLLPAQSLPVFGLVVRAAAGGAVLSILMQGGRYFLPGRVPGATDLVLNTTGALLGAGVICFRFLSRRQLAWLTAVCIASFVLAATWPCRFSLQAASPRALAVRFEWSPYHSDFSFDLLRERALNGLMMMPLGLLAAAFALRSRTVKKALIYTTYLGFASSVSVELLQCFLPNRTPSLSDVTLNTLGTLAGGLVSVYLYRTGVIREVVSREGAEGNEGR